MKKTILTSVCLSAMLFVSGNALAQDAGKTKSPQATTTKAAPMTLEQKADKHVKRLTTELNLTADQQKQIYDVVLASLKQEEADKVTANGDAAKEKELSTARMKTKSEAFRKILTPDQYAKIEAKWKAESGKENTTKK